MNKLITILGPTAGGKTSVGTHLAHALNTEVISADSRQLYRGMDIGTGKDLDDYVVEGTPVPYHLIDIFDAGYKCNVYEYQRLFFEAYNSVIAKNKIPVLCGGTGMYIDAVTNAYTLVEVPENTTLRKSLENTPHPQLIEKLLSYGPTHNTTDTSTIKRTIRAIEIQEHYKANNVTQTQYPKLDTLYIGIIYERSKQRKNITDRLQYRLQHGMIEETEKLVAQGVSFSDLEYYGLEYKFISQYLQGNYDYDTFVEKLNIAIHQFAKRQVTWFRGMERKGTKIHWIEGEKLFEEKLDIAKNLAGEFINSAIF